MRHNYVFQPTNSRYARIRRLNTALELTLMSAPWIFLSIARSHGGHLTDVISAADHINCAIPTDEELQTNVNRLMAASLVLVKNGQFFLTAKGQALFESAGGLGAYPRLQVSIVAPLLDVALKTQADSASWSLEPNEGAAASAAYKKRMRQVKRSRK